MHIEGGRDLGENIKIADDEIVWTRGYSDDYWNDPVSPLFFELLGDQLTQIVNVELNEIMGYSKPGTDKTDKLLRLYRAHAYFNLEVLKRKVEYEIPPFVRNNDILNYFQEGKGQYGKETMKKQPFRLTKRAMAEIRVMLHDGNGSITKTASAYEAWTKEQFEPFYEKFDARMGRLSQDDASGYIELATELDRLMIRHFRLVRYGIPVHNIGMNLIAQYLLGRFLGKEDAAASYPALLSGLRHKTSETNDALFHLASTIQTNPRLRSIVLETPSNRLLTRLKVDGSPASAKFSAELESFFKNFGVRGFTREPYYPRWHEAPEHIFNILKAIVQDEDPEGRLGRKQGRDETAEKEIEDRVKSQRAGRVKWALFSTVLNFARKYIVFRENQRFNLDRWITMNRKLFLAVGINFQNRKILSEPSDVFFLRKNEIRGLAEGKFTSCKTEEIKRVVEERKAEFLRDENVTPPKFLKGNCELDDPAQSYKTELTGIPASQGVLTGPVRVLDRIDDIWRVRTGEILVVPRTDPGWTPVFGKIGGLITETGGLLSHGAVVSREYRIPAVTNIPNACRIFKTGQTVTIDGSKGTVCIN